MSYIHLTHVSVAHASMTHASVAHVSKIHMLMAWVIHSGLSRGTELARPARLVRLARLAARELDVRRSSTPTNRIPRARRGGTVFRSADPSSTSLTVMFP